MQSIVLLKSVLPMRTKSIVQSFQSSDMIFPTPTQKLNLDLRHMQNMGCTTELWAFPQLIRVTDFETF